MPGYSPDRIDLILTLSSSNEKIIEKIPPVTEKIIQEAESSISKKNDKINLINGPINKKKILKQQFLI